MRGLKGLAPLILIGVAGLAWLLVVSEPGSHWLTAFLAPPPSPGPPVAKLIRADGSLKRIHGGDVQKLKAPLAEPILLYDGDRLETDQDSRALITLNSQDEMELLPLTAVGFQLWNEKDPASAIYLNILTGDLELKKSGLRGRTYVVRDGRLYLPGQKPGRKSLALTVLRSAPLDMLLAEAPTTNVSDFESDNARAEENGAQASRAEPETLSNEYIDEMMVSRQAQLQKCWLAGLKEKPDLKGEIIVQFTISRRGKVKDLKVADASLTEESLQRCVLSVVERITFRTFKGPEISLSYPLRFE